MKPTLTAIEGADRSVELSLSDLRWLLSMVELSLPAFRDQQARQDCKIELDRISKKIEGAQP